MTERTIPTEAAITVALAAVCIDHDGPDCALCKEALDRRRGRGMTAAQILADIDLRRVDYSLWATVGRLRVDLEGATTERAGLVWAALGVTPLDDDPRHLIEFREDGWTIKHPLSCRPNLFDCPVNRAAGEQVDGPPPAGFGRYDCWIGEQEFAGMLFLGDRIDQKVRTDG
ncbi:hypothetical protein ACGFI9_12250 [Micromonospora sp. NPDC048930]|uniref:hypothetical protein n=1 Tax=Micromonospora sp. NPDC048930 TaxID=3364261 RepID=UPI0037206806